MVPQMAGLRLSSLSHTPSHILIPQAAQGALRNGAGLERAQWPRRTGLSARAHTSPHIPHTCPLFRQHKARYEVEQDLNELDGLVSDSEGSKSSIRQLGDMAQELMAAWREELAALQQQLPTLMGECGRK